MADSNTNTQHTPASPSTASQQPLHHHRTPSGAAAIASAFSNSVTSGGSGNPFLAALANEHAWAVKDMGLNCISGVINDPGASKSGSVVPISISTLTNKQNKENVVPPIPSVFIRKVRLSDFDLYLKHVGPVYDKFLYNRTMGVAAATEGTPQLSSADADAERGDAAFAALLSRYQSQLPNQAGASSFYFSEKERSKQHRKLVSMNAPALDTIPKIFFKPDFNLEDPAVFTQVSEYAAAVSSTTQDSSQQQQHANDDPLLHYLDTVDIHLIREISRRSSQFFTALANLQALHQETLDCVSQIHALRKKLANVSTMNSKQGLEVVRLKRRRENVGILCSGIKLVHEVKQTQPMIQVLLGQGDYVGALDLIEEATKVLRGGQQQQLQSQPQQDTTTDPQKWIRSSGLPRQLFLRGVRSLQHFNGQLTEMAKTIGLIIDAEYVNSLIQDLRETLSTINATTKISPKMLETVVATWISNMLKGVLSNMSLSSTGGASSASTPTLQLRDLLTSSEEERLKSRLLPMVMALLRMDKLTASFTHYKDELKRELKTATKKHYPVLPEDTAAKLKASLASTTSQSTTGTSTTTSTIPAVPPPTPLARYLRTQQFEPFFNLVTAIFSTYTHIIARTAAIHSITSGIIREAESRGVVIGANKARNDGTTGDKSKEEESLPPPPVSSSVDDDDELGKIDIGIGGGKPITVPAVKELIPPAGNSKHSRERSGSLSGGDKGNVNVNVNVNAQGKSDVVAGATLTATGSNAGANTSNMSTPTGTTGGAVTANATTTTSTSSTPSTLETSYSQLLQESHDILYSITDECHTRCTRLLSVRQDQNAQLGAPQFFRLFSATWEFIHATESLCNKPLGGALKGTMVGQAKLFFQNFHDAKMKQMAMLIEYEQWTLAEVPIEFQRIADQIVLAGSGVNVGDGANVSVTASSPTTNKVTTTSTMASKLRELLSLNDGNHELLNDEELEELIRTSNTALDELGSPPVSPTKPKPQQNQQSPDRKSTRYLVMDNEKFFVAGVVLMFLRTLSEYVQCTEHVPSLTMEVLNKILEILKLFNSRTCQVILGAGALKSAGLDKITTKHIVLTAQSIGVLVHLIPYLKGTIQKHLTSRQLVLLNDYDKMVKEYVDHQNELFNRLVKLMDERLAGYITSSFTKINWDEVKDNKENQQAQQPEVAENTTPVTPKPRPPNTYMAQIVKDTITLYRVLVKFLDSEKLKQIMSQVFTSYHKRFEETFSKMDFYSIAAKDKLLNDAQYFIQSLSALDGVDGPTSHLEVLVNNIKIKEKPVSPASVALPSTASASNNEKKPLGAASLSTATSAFKGMGTGMANLFKKDASSTNVGSTATTSTVPQGPIGGGTPITPETIKMLQQQSAPSTSTSSTTTSKLKVQDAFSKMFGGVGKSASSTSVGGTVTTANMKGDKPLPPPVPSPSVSASALPQPPPPPKETTNVDPLMGASVEPVNKKDGDNENVPKIVEP